MGAKQSLHTRSNSTTRTRVHLYWVSRCVRTFHSLSSNVIREICLYFPPFQSRLIWVKSEKVLYFDVGERIWKVMFKFQTELKMDVWSSSVFLDNDQIFLIGNCETKKSSAYLITNGEVRREGELSELRLYQGVVYLPSRLMIYVFGGKRGDGTIYPDCLHTAERFDLRSRKWQSIPAMSIARHSFNPCLYSSVLYLIGGNEKGCCEFFDPYSKTYTALSFTTQAGSTLTVSRGSSLHVFSSYTFQRWDMNSGEVQQKEHWLHSMLCSCPPMVGEDKMWIYNPYFGKVYEFTIEGEVQAMY